LKSRPADLTHYGLTYYGCAGFSSIMRISPKVFSSKVPVTWPVSSLAYFNLPCPMTAVRQSRFLEQ
jgi:hypothetical protein